MAKPRIVTGKASILKHSYTYTDALQKAVEREFVRGTSLKEIEERLGLPPAEAFKRYEQVFRFYSKESKNMTEEWAKMQTLCLLKQAIERKEALEARVNTVLKAGDDRRFPLKEYEALQKIDAFVYKIMADIRKEYSGPQVAVDGKAGNGDEPFIFKGNPLRKKLQEVRDNSPLSYRVEAHEEKDLEAAVVSASLFDDDEDEEE